MLSRRSFVASSLASSALAPLVLRGAYKKIPVGLEMYSVRGELMKDVPGTVNAVAKMGYQVMEFYAPYFQWTDGVHQGGSQAVGRFGSAV